MATGLLVLNGPTIQAGESLSDGIDTGPGEIVRITMPPTWSGPHTISFQISTDGNGYNDLFKADGKEIVMTVTTGAAVLVDPELTRAVVWLKIRSGTRAQPIPQEGKRDFALAVTDVVDVEPPADDPLSVSTENLRRGDAGRS